MINYIVDKEKGIVTAEISNCKDDVKKHIAKQFGFIGELDELNKDLAKACRISDKFTGVAKCHPEDIFDEEVGKRIAKQRVLDKYSEARVNALNRVDNLIDNWSYLIMFSIQNTVKSFLKSLG